MTARVAKRPSAAIDARTTRARSIFFNRFILVFYTSVVV